MRKTSFDATPSPRATLVTDPLTNATTVPITTYSANWTLLPNSAMDVGSTGAKLNSASTAVRPGAMYSGASFPNDQWAQIQLGALFSGSYIGCGVRMDGTSGGNGYLLDITSTALNLIVYTNGAQATQLLSLTITNVANDVFRLSVIGSLLMVDKNGTNIFKVTNTAHTTGLPGICSQGTVTTATGVNFQAGSTVYSPSTPGFLLSPYNILMGGTVANTWRTLTVPTDPQGAAGVPPDTTTGIILAWQNGANASWFMTRTPGSSFNTLPGSTLASAANTWGYVTTGVTFSGTPEVANFDFVTSNPTGMAMYCIGYFGSEAVFFPDPVPVTIPFPGSGDLTTNPATLNIAAQCPGAVAVFANLWGSAVRMVPQGDSSIMSYLPTSPSAQSIISGVNAGQVTVTGSGPTSPTLYLRGYMTRGFAWRAPAVDVSPTSAATWVPIAAGGVYSAGNPIGFLYVAAGSNNFNVRNYYGQGALTQKAPMAGNMMLSVFGNSTSPPSINAAATPLTLAEQGYFVASSAPVGPGPPTAVRSYFAIRTTSQS